MIIATVVAIRHIIRPFYKLLPSTYQGIALIMIFTKRKLNIVHYFFYANKKEEIVLEIIKN